MSLLKEIIKKNRPYNLKKKIKNKPLQKPNEKKKTSVPE